MNFEFMKWINSHVISQQPNCKWTLLK